VGQRAVDPVGDLLNIEEARSGGGPWFLLCATFLTDSEPEGSYEQYGQVG
jgi:hypothetical protein